MRRLLSITLFVGLAMLAVTAAGRPGAASAALPASREQLEIVIRASDIRQGQLNGVWTLASDPSSPDGLKLAIAGAGPIDRPLADPQHYFEVAFAADAETPYRVWLRLRGQEDAPQAGSVWLQFSDSEVAGRPAYRIGSAGALSVSVARCGGCTTSGWGWRDSSWWSQQSSIVEFSRSGRQTTRIQLREDGVELDQIVLSAKRYLQAAPGAVEGDATTVGRPVAVPLARDGRNRP